MSTAVASRPRRATRPNAALQAHLAEAASSRGAYVSDTAKYPRTGKRGAPQAFPRKLFEILCQEPGDIIGWTEGGSSFLIKDMETFVIQVLMKYFRHQKYSSFQRQLNLYGFRKVSKGSNVGAYAHKYFLEGRHDLLVKVRRMPQASTQPEKDAAKAKEKADKHAALLASRQRKGKRPHKAPVAFGDEGLEVEGLDGERDDCDDDLGVGEHDVVFSDGADSDQDAPSIHSDDEGGPDEARPGNGGGPGGPVHGEGNGGRAGNSMAGLPRRAIAAREVTSSTSSSGSLRGGIPSSPLSSLRVASSGNDALAGFGTPRSLASLTFDFSEGLSPRVGMDVQSGPGDAAGPPPVSSGDAGDDLLMGLLPSLDLPASPRQQHGAHHNGGGAGTPSLCSQLPLAMPPTPPMKMWGLGFDSTAGLDGNGAASMSPRLTMQGLHPAPLLAVTSLSASTQAESKAFPAATGSPSPLEAKASANSASAGNSRAKTASLLSCMGDVSDDMDDTGGDDADSLGFGSSIEMLRGHCSPITAEPGRAQPRSPCVAQPVPLAVPLPGLTYREPAGLVLEAVPSGCAPGSGGSAATSPDSSRAASPLAASPWTVTATDLDGSLNKGLDAVIDDTQKLALAGSGLISNGLHHGAVAPTSSSRPRSLSVSSDDWADTQDQAAGDSGLAGLSSGVMAGGSGKGLAAQGGGPAYMSSEDLAALFQPATHVPMAR